jgi:hypothetical protein
MRRTAISILLKASGPAAVAGLIIPIVIDSVQRRIGGPIPHVGKERYETLPAVANPDPSAAIPVEGMMVAPGTALPHLSPASIFWPHFALTRTNAGRPVNKMMAALAFAFLGMLGQPLLIQTSTTLGSPFFIACEIIRKQNLFSPAVASAQPSGAPLSLLVGAPDDDKPAKTLTAAVYQGGSHSQGLYHN